MWKRRFFSGILPRMMSYLPNFWTEFDEAAMARNMDALQRRAGPGVRIAPVVKGDAYGHGMLRVTRALERMGGAAMFVLGSVDAAVWLRTQGIATPILLVGTWLPEHAPLLLQHAVTPTLFSPGSAAALNAAATAPAACHLRVDTCHCGTGMAPGELPAFIETLPSLPNLRVEALYTHLFASYTDPAATDAALDEFDRLFASLPAAFRASVFRHAANTAAIFGHPRSHYQMIRPGNALYGLPFKPGQPSLEPCLAIKGRVTAIRGARTPWRLGYHSKNVVASRLATVPAGTTQAPWLLTQSGIDALVRGQRAPVLSTGMEYCYLDVSRIPGVAVGDEVTFLGKQGHDAITIPELLQRTGVDITNCERFCFTEHPLL